MVKKIKISKQDLAFNIIVYTLMSIIGVIFLYPLIYVVSASITAPSDILTGKMWLFPTTISFIGYEHILKETSIWLGYLNSIFLCVVGTALSLVVTFMAGYVWKI